MAIATLSIDIEARLASLQDGLDKTMRSVDQSMGRLAGSVTAVPAFGLSHEAEMTGAKATAYQSFIDIVLDDGVTATEWRKSTDLAERTFYNVRAALIDDGKIEKRGQRYFLAQKPIEELMPDAV